ncbi:MAG: substrate-binding periplasmic protein [Acidimicrobiales bacterium]
MASPLPSSLAARVLLAVVLVGAALTGAATLPAAASPAAMRALGQCRASLPTLEHVPGVLTVATERPSNWPWFIDDRPANGRGYESALVYAIAKSLGVARRDVHWVQQPYATATAPGAKSFDFDADEIVQPASASTAVTYSSAYYDLHTALVTRPDSRIATHHDAAALRTYRYGALVGSVELSYLQRSLHPRRAPQAFTSVSSLLVALRTGTVDAIALDTASALSLVHTPAHASGAALAIVGQFSGVSGHFALVFQHRNPLAACVDESLALLRGNGTLSALQRRWLAPFAAVPTLQP